MEEQKDTDYYGPEPETEEAVSGIKRKNPLTGWIKKHNKAVISIAAVAALALVFIFCYKPLMLWAAPQYYLKKSMKATNTELGNYAKQSPLTLFPILGKCMSKGSVKIQIRGIENPTSEDGEVSLEFEANTDLENQQILLGAKLKKLQSYLDGELYLDPDQISVKSAALFGSEEHYGIALQDIRARLEDSVFAPDSGGRYALTQEQVNDLEKAQDVIKSVLSKGKSGISSLKEDLASTFQKISSYKKPEVSSETVTINEEKVKATVMRYIYEGDDLKDIASIFVDGLLQSQTMKEILGEEGYPEFKMKALKLVEQLREESLDAGLSIAYYINSRDEVMQIKIEGTPENEGGLTITYGVDVKKSNRFQVELNLGILVLKLNSEGDRQSEVFTDTTTIEAEIGGVKEAVAIHTTWDRQNGDLKLELTNQGDGDNKITILGNLLLEGNESFKLEISELAYTGQGGKKTIPVSFTIEADLTSEISKPTLKSILDMKEQELDALLERADIEYEGFLYPYAEDVIPE